MHNVNIIEISRIVIFVMQHIIFPLWGSHYMTLSSVSNYPDQHFWDASIYFNVQFDYKMM